MNKKSGAELKVVSKVNIVVITWHETSSDGLNEGEVSCRVRCYGDHLNWDD